MQNDDGEHITIMSSWAAGAYRSFAAELEELQCLRGQHEAKSGEASDMLSARCRVTVDAQLQKEYPDLFPLLATNNSPVRSVAGSKASSPTMTPQPLGTAGATKRAKPKSGQQQQQAEVALLAAKRETMLQQQREAALQSQERQPAHQLAARYAQQLSTMQRHVHIFLDREVQELQRFNAKPLASYALGEVLDTPPPPPRPPGLLSPTKPPVGASFSPSPGGGRATVMAPSLSRAGSERGSMRTLQPKKSTVRLPVRGTARTGRSRMHSTVVVDDRPEATSAEPAERHGISTFLPLPPFLIDAHKFAVEYNEMLKREYGYRPAMTNTFPVSTKEGTAGEAGANADGGTAASPMDADAVTAARQRAKLQRHGQEDAAKRSNLGGANNYDRNGWLPPLSTSTPPPQAGGRGAASRGLARTAPAADGGCITAASQSPQRGYKCTATSKTTKAARSRSSAEASVQSGITCSVKESGLHLCTCVGETASQIVKFVNRNAYTTRLRLKMSTHPWLTFRCISRTRPGEGDAPLNAGGSLEVEVTFSPRELDVSCEVVQTTLTVGVAREVNDQSGGGGQWQFLSVPVEAKVRLPHFEWWWRRRPRGQAEEEEESGRRARRVGGAERLMNHDAVTACADHLDVAGGAAVVFGDALVLARSRETLLLENTGSTAVVNVLCSSPEFALDFSPERAVALRPGESLPLSMTFIPLKEGMCDAVLTIAVRGSADEGSPILMERTVELRGTGVLPRVRITAVADQIVAEEAGENPQWQQMLSTGPLRAILRDTMPVVPTTVAVTVANACSVPLRFRWQGGTDAVGEVNELGEEEETVEAPPLSSMMPSSGTLPAFATVDFALTVTVVTLQPLQTLFNLYLDGLPDPTSPENADLLPYLNSAVVEFYRRSRLIPCMMHQAERERDGEVSGERACTTAEDMAAGGRAMEITYLDPVAAFTRFHRSGAPELAQSAADDGSAFDIPSVAAEQGVFVSSCLTFQQPVLPTMGIAPSVVEEQVECLLRCRNTRTVTLHNYAPIPLHFTLDPTMSEFIASLRQQQRIASPVLTRLCGTVVAEPSASTFERWRSYFPTGDGIAVQCHPRCGVIPPQGNVHVTVHFTLEACGPHYAIIPCWVPELELLRALLSVASGGSSAWAVGRTSPSTRSPSRSLQVSGRVGHGRSSSTSVGPNGRLALPPSSLSSAAEATGWRLSGRAGVKAVPSGPSSASTTPPLSPAEEALLVIEDGGCYAINVTATGVGPTVRASTDLLDFGLIELGQEAAASFTVSNPNSVAVVFDLADPLMRQPPRFVFIPESFRLGPGNTVEVTVYRKAVSTEDAQTFFELTVRDGGSAIAIETRATIQQPLLVVENPVVSFGVMPEGVWRHGTFWVTNRSAIDTSFALTAATPVPSYMELSYDTDYVLRAGERREVEVRCRFRAAPPVPSGSMASSTLVRRSTGAGNPAAEDRYVTLLGVVSKRSRQALLVEVRGEGVERLAVSVDLFQRSPEQKEEIAVAPTMSTADYLRALLLNALGAALPVYLSPSSSSAVVVGEDAATGPREQRRAKFVQAAEDASVLPYCGPVHVVRTMSDELPLSRCSVDVRLRNYTGCEARFTLVAAAFTPQSIERTGTRRIMDKQRAASTARNSRVGSIKVATGTSAMDVEGQENANSASVMALMDLHNALGGAGEGEVAPPAWWTASTHGAGSTGQQHQRQLLAAAESVLGDGCGCATVLQRGAGTLGPFGVISLPVQLWCGMPGFHREQLCVRADPTLPLLRLPVDFEVFGKPIVLDATTSGLTKQGGREGEDVLLMPPVIAPLGTSRRTIRLVNRVPRDMDVAVEVYPCRLGMTLRAIDPDVPASEVEMRLVPMTAADRAREAHRVGAVTATPVQLRMPALSRRQVVLEFTPNAGMAHQDGEEEDNVPHFAQDDKQSGKGTPGAGGRREAADLAGQGSDESMLPPKEKWWEGSVCIHPVLAESETNDVFLIDEFYTRNAHRYPTRRVARPLSDGASPSTTGPVAQVPVMLPLRSRPKDRVVRNSRIVWPTAAEQRVLDRHTTQQAAVASEEEASKARETTGQSSSDEDADADPAFMDRPSIHSIAQTSSGGAGAAADSKAALPSLTTLLAEQEECRALLDFMAERRQALRKEGAEYFSSIELRLRARCGKPVFAVAAGEETVVFPPVVVGGGADLSKGPAARSRRTVRITNSNSAAIRCGLSVTGPQLVSVTSSFASQGTADTLAPETDFFAITRCSLWRTGGGAETVLFNALTANKGDGTDAAVALQEYMLESMDALDVTVEALSQTKTWRNYEATCVNDAQGAAAAVVGSLKVQFLSTSVVPAETELPAQYFHLHVPLSVASLSCTQDVVWFKPGQLRHDGRPQVAYAQSFTLYNTSTTISRFHIRHCRLQQNPDAESDTVNATALRTLRSSLSESLFARQGAATLERSVAQVNNSMTRFGVAATSAQSGSLTRVVAAVVRMPETVPPTEGQPELLCVDEPSQFTLSPVSGVIPAASRGGKPGEMRIRVNFREFSDVRYESLYEVVVEGTESLPPTYILLRGDSRVTEL